MKENNREEDIKILETVVNYRKFDGIYNTNEVIFKSIEHLIKAYKELKEENKTLNERNQYLVKYRAKLEKELYESNENYIPISLVEKKIEELKEKGESDLKTYGFAIETHLAKQVLQELLEKR